VEYLLSVDEIMPAFALGHLVSNLT
jgi:hypothetical protein